MGFKLADLFVQVSANGITQVDGQLGLIKSGLSSAAMAATGLGGIFTAGALGIGLRSCIQAFSEAEQYGARLDAVLRSTQQAAGYSGEQIRALTADLQKITRFEDDSTNAAAAMLLTFKEIKGPIFKDALESAMDLSTVMGQDLRSSIMQLGKALQDPTTGMTALRRAGVSFDDAQKEIIENLQKSGNLMEAQKMILAELHSEFGGAARADAETMAGAIDRMKNAWGDLAETVGGKVAPAMKAVAEFLQGAANGPLVFGKSEDTNKAINSRSVSTMREQMQKLNAEENHIQGKRFLFGWGALVGRPGIEFSDEDKQRLAQIKSERAQLAHEAEKLGPKEFEKREVANRVFRNLGGAKHELTDAERKAQAGALGALSHPGKEKDEHRPGKNLLGYFDKIGKAQERIREEGRRMMQDSLTPAEHYIDKLKEIDRLKTGNGLTGEQADRARHTAARDLAEGMTRKDTHADTGRKMGMQDLAGAIQESILKNAAEKKAETDRAKMVTALENIKDKGIPISNLDQVKLVVGA